MRHGTRPGRGRASADAHAAGETRENTFAIYQRYGQLQFIRWLKNDLTTLELKPYDAIAHRYWQIRGTREGKVAYETSADGLLFTTHFEVEPEGPIDKVRIDLGARSDGPAPDPGAVEFAAFNGGAPEGSFCPASSLTADFDDGVEGRVWRRSFDKGCSRSMVNGRAVSTPAVNAQGVCGFASGTAYDMTGDAFAIEVPVMVNTQAEGPEGVFRLEEDGSNFVEFVQGNGELHLRRTLFDSSLLLAKIPYSTVTHRFWRFREQAGSLRWETSSDGRDWVVRHEVSPSPISVDAVDVLFFGGAWLPHAAPGAVHFDNLNLMP